MDAHDFARLALRGNKESLRALLDTGYDVNATDNWEMTPLMWAAQGGHIGCVQLLLERGADACKSNSSELTAVHCAITGGHLEVLRLLLASAADPATLDRLFRAPFPVPFMISERSDTLSFSLACGFRLKAPSMRLKAPSMRLEAPCYAMEPTNMLCMRRSFAAPFPICCEGSIKYLRAV